MWTVTFHLLDCWCLWHPSYPFPERATANAHAWHVLHLYSPFVGVVMIACEAKRKAGVGCHGANVWMVDEACGVLIA